MWSQICPHPLFVQAKFATCLDVCVPICMTQLHYQREALFMFKLCLIPISPPMFYDALSAMPKNMLADYSNQ